MPYTLSCKHCGQPFSSSDKRRRFCTQSCSAKHSNTGRERTPESRRKASVAVREALGLPPALANFEKPKGPKKPRAKTAPLNPDGTAHRYGPYLHKGHGYLYYTDIYPNGERRKVQAHQAVLAEAGLPPTPRDVVHHKDRSRRNNDLANLAVLSRPEHARLHARERGRAMVHLRCPWCSQEFTRPRGNTHLVPSRSGGGTFCSRSCRAAFYRANLPKEDVQERFDANVIKQFRDRAEVS